MAHPRLKLSLSEVVGHFLCSEAVEHLADEEDAVEEDLEEVKCGEI